MLLEKITNSVSWFFTITLAKIRTFSWLFQHPCPISVLLRSWKMKSQISGLFKTSGNPTRRTSCDHSPWHIVSCKLQQNSVIRMKIWN